MPRPVTSTKSGSRAVRRGKARGMNDIVDSSRPRSQEPAPAGHRRRGQAWHALTVSDVFARLGSDERGLASEEAAAPGCNVTGPNELAAAARISPWSLLLAQFKNVLIVILLVAVGPLGAAGARPRGDRHRGDHAVRGGARLRPGVPGGARHRGAAPDGGAASRPCCATARSRTSRPATWCPATSSCSKPGDRCPRTPA